MPWKKSEKLPAAAEKLKGHERDIFVAAANSALKEYEGDEVRAIRTGLAAVNSYREKKKDSVKKSIFEAIGQFLEKSFPSYDVEKSQEVVNEEMVSYEVVYEPDTKDAHGQWMSLETIEKGCENFNENLNKGVVQPNLFHLQNTEAFSIESTWIQKEFDVKVVQTDEIIKAGTWVAKIKYHDAELWELKKAGVIGGVSIGGSGFVNQETGEITELTFDGDMD